MYQSIWAIFEAKSIFTHMENEKLPIGMIVFSMLKSIFRVVESRAYKHTGLKITMVQYVLLRTINDELNEVILKDVAEKIGKDKSSVMRTIDQLEKKELLRRVVDQTDRRKNLLFVTKKGERYIADFTMIGLQLTQELQADISADDLQAFYRTVSCFQQKADQLFVS